MRGFKLAAVTFGGVALAIVPGIVMLTSSAGAASVQQVTVPEADRFTPFAITIKAGDTVKWVNNDTDDHTVVSDDPFVTAGNTGTNHLLPGTDSNGGHAGVFTLQFTHVGAFVYYCRFHSHLDAFNQPVAPGPHGGIQDAHGNFGTPMMGVITVVP